MTTPSLSVAPGVTTQIRLEQLRATGDLPSPKGSALAIIRLTQREDTSLGELAQMVKTDPAFVGRLIKAANSAHAGSRRPVASIPDALTLLGMPTVRNLALGFSLLSGYRSGNCRNFDYPRFWSHSLVFAVALQALVQRNRVAPTDEAFCVGLLARVGELALATLFPDTYSTLREQAAADAQADIQALEYAAFVMTHGELTAAMLEDWGLPRLYCEPVRYLDCPSESDFADNSRQSTLLHSAVLADAIADICLADEAARRTMMSHLFMLGGRLSLDADTLTALCDGVAAEWVAWGALLNVETTTLPPFDELSKAGTGMPAETEGDALGAGSGMRILVVDDDATMRAMITALLKKSGHEVYSAPDGRKGFELALDVRPQIMVVDWMMPEMNGVELTKSLRQTKIGRGIYVLILTGIDDDEHLVEAFESGVDDFMNKPLKPRVLAARLRAAQRVIRLQQEIEGDREEIRRFAAELAITNRRLQEVALTDSLTGFPNRRYAMERFSQEWSAAARSGRALSCMVIDVDGFKEINDSYGHDVGDAVLRQIANALKSGLRSQDVVCRTGGDEFLVICPDTDRAAAILCAERMCRAVESFPLMVDGARLHGSISVGVAERVGAMADFHDLIKAADKGVYAAKDKGRNRVETVQPA